MKSYLKVFIIGILLLLLAPSCHPDSSIIDPPTPISLKIKSSKYSTKIPVTMFDVIEINVIQDFVYESDKLKNISISTLTSNKFFKIEYEPNKIIVRDSSVGVLDNTGNVIFLQPSTVFIDSIYYYDGGDLFSVTKVQRNPDNSIKNIKFGYLPLGPITTFSDFLYDANNNIKSFKFTNSAGGGDITAKIQYDVTKMKKPLTEHFLLYNNLPFENSYNTNAYRTNDPEILGVKFGNTSVHVATSVTLYVGGFPSPSRVEPQILSNTSNLISITNYFSSKDTLVNTYF